MIDGVETLYIKAESVSFNTGLMHWNVSSTAEHRRVCKLYFKQRQYTQYNETDMYMYT